MTSEERNSPTPLYGLVLAGGKSVRMGQDKSVLQWHGKEQRYYMADLLGSVCDDVYISCRPEQETEMDNNYKTITDNYPGGGPLIGILSAFRYRADVAWLVTACDLPLLDEATLRFLITHRDPDAMATTFQSPHDRLPEPLITIWEPSGFERLQAHIPDGYTCPRKALIRNEVHVKVMLPPNAEALMNANTPADAEKVKEMLRKKGSSI